MEDKDFRLYFVIIVLMITCIVLKILSATRVTNVNSTNTWEEVFFERAALDINSLSKKDKKKYTIIDGVAYEKVSDKDKKNKDDNVIVKIIQGIDNTIKELSDKLHDYDQDEVKDEDAIIPSNIKVKMK